MFFSWLKDQRRKALVAEQFPDAWDDCLRRNVRHYGHLTLRDQARMRQAVLFTEEAGPDRPYRRSVPSENLLLPPAQWEAPAGCDSELGQDTRL